MSFSYSGVVYNYFHLNYLNILNFDTVYYDITYIPARFYKLLFVEIYVGIKVCQSFFLILVILLIY